MDMNRLHMQSSVATLSNPVFINVDQINPMISKCEIKVMYVGHNRNGTYISKEMATEMSKTLPGSPIVGRFYEDFGDFGDHEKDIEWDSQSGEFKEISGTMPYGFVGTDARVWFQTYTDTDLHGNSVEREYLVTEGYLWTGRYPELSKVTTSGSNQSMELTNVDGVWAEDPHTRCSFFIINDGSFSGLCILGDDVEPCMEGASVTSYSKDTNTLIQEVHSMMKEVSFALANVSKKEEIDTMDTTVTKNVEDLTAEQQALFNAEDSVISEPAVDTVEAGAEVEPVVEENFSAETNPDESDFAKKDEEEDDKKEDSKSEDKSEEDEEDDEEKKNKNFKKEEEDEDKKDQSDSDKKEDTTEDEDDEDKKKYDLSTELEALKADYAALETKYNAEVEKSSTIATEFAAYKAESEKADKEALINSFSTLSAEEKSDVVENINTYSLDEIEAKLSIAFARAERAKSESKEAESKEDALSFTLDAKTAESVPEWIKSVQSTRENNQN